MNNDVIKVGNGILDQIKNSNFKIKIDPFWYCEEKKTTIIVSEAADYSVFIKKDLSGIKGVSIKTKSMDKWLTTEEIMVTPSGSILYFKEKVGDIFKSGCIYPALLYYRPTNKSLEKTLDDYIKYIFKVQVENANS